MPPISQTKSNYINNDKYINTLLRVYYQFDITL